MATSYLLFDTALGAAGIAWSAGGIRRVQLPARTEAETEARLVAGLSVPVRVPPSLAIRGAVRLLQLHLGGEPQDLTELRLDLEGLPAFHRRVYAAARSVAAGRTVTYGELAARAGSPGAARAVGQALARNPLPVIVPCHRVLAAGGRPGGFSAFGGLWTKARLLETEGVLLRQGLFRGAGALPFDAGRAVRALRVRDPGMRRLIDLAGPFDLRIETLQSPFASLAEAIVHQQLTGKAAQTILRRVRDLVPGPRFPRPEAIRALPVAALRSAGLSGAKAAALHDLADKTLDGTVPPLSALRRLDDESVIERLTAVRGIGRWTVEMLLIFRLGRPDVLPIHDYGLRKGLGRLLRKRQVPTPGEVARHGERWRPWRSVASWYLWRAAEMRPGWL